MWLPPLRFVALVAAGFAAGAVAGALAGLAGSPPSGGAPARQPAPPGPRARPTPLEASAS